MESIRKESYEAPTTNVVVVKQECIICQSGVKGTRNGYGDAIEDDWA